MGSRWILSFGIASTLFFCAEGIGLFLRARQRGRLRAEAARSGRRLPLLVDRRRRARRRSDPR